MELRNVLGFAAVAALAFGAASCSNDEEMANTLANEQELRVNVGIRQTANVRAGITANKFANDEAIGLYLYKGSSIVAGEEGNYPQVGDHKAKNAHYKHVKDGDYWTVGTAGQGIVLSDVVGSVFAYYPYAAGNAAVEASAIPVEVKANQGSGLSDGTKDDTQSDYMYATKVGDVSNSTPSVNLEMNHALSMLSFKFVKGDYPGKGLVSSIKVMNAQGKKLFKTGAATMNLDGGALTVTGTEGNVTIEPNAVLAKGKEEVHAATEIARMLVYPIASFTAEDLKVQIVLDGKTYTLNIPVTESPDTKSYVAGKNYQYTFNLAGKEFGGEGEDGKDDITVTVKGWDDVTAGSGDLISPDAI